MTDDTSALNVQEVADLLRRSTPHILAQWKKRALKEVPAASQQPTLSLINSLPVFLEELAATLERPDSESLCESKSEVAKEHGEERAEAPSYTLDQVIYEYQILREELIDMLNDHRISVATRKVIHTYIDCGIRKSSVEFTNLQQYLLSDAKERAENASREKSIYLANMSHEIRTPLAAILGFSELLKEPSLDGEERRQYVDTILSNGTALTRIIDDILDLAKVEAGKLEFETLEFNLYDLFTEVTDLLREKARQKDLFLLLTLDENVPTHICSDPSRIRQIMLNLIGNAIKFTDQGGVRVHVRAAENRENKIKLTIDVKDTGIGISEEQKKQLFKPFSQAESSTARKYGGTGLGLVLSQKLCAALGGTLAITESTPGRGSTFTAKFDAMEFCTSPKFQSAKKEQFERAHRLDGIHVLVVDDSPDNLFLAQHLLKKSGAKVSTAASGREALGLAEKKPDIVLLDIQMPMMDGYEVLENLKALHFEKPVVALTAHAMSDEREKTKSAGFAAHLTKPLDAKKLFSCIISLCKTNAG